jgi:hypothetical protein
MAAAAVAALALAAPGLANATVTFNGSWLYANVLLAATNGNHTANDAAYSLGPPTTIGGTHSFTDSKTTTTFVKIGKKLVPITTTKLEDSGILTASTGAILFDAASGAYNLTQGVNLTNADAANGSYAAAWGAYVYDFVVSNPFNFTISYDATGGSSTTGVGSSATTPDLYTYLYDYTPPNAFNSFHVVPGDSGSLTFANLPAGSYQLYTYDWTEPEGQDYFGIGTASSNINANYSFEINEIPPAPEPATWAMMLAGLFGLGGALRSRRRLAAIAA